MREGVRFDETTGKFLRRTVDTTVDAQTLSAALARRMPSILARLTPPVAPARNVAPVALASE